MRPRYFGTFIDARLHDQLKRRAIRQGDTIKENVDRALRLYLHHLPLIGDQIKDASKDLRQIRQGRASLDSLDATIANLERLYAEIVRLQVSEEAR